MLYNKKNVNTTKALEYNLYEVYLVKFFIGTTTNWYNENHLAWHVLKQLSSKITYYYYLLMVLLLK